MVSAFVFIQVGDAASWDEMRTMHEELHAVAGVKTVHFLSGPTDVIVFVDAADQPALAEAVGAIRAVKGVGRTDTRIVWPL